MRRSPIRSKRAAPRRRDAPRESSDWWTEANEILHARAGGMCECCGNPLSGRVERHHRMRRRDGGDRICNLMLLLSECHKYWTEHPAEAKSRGIIVEPWKDVRHTPILFRGITWAIATDEGSLIYTDLSADFRIVG